MVNLLLGMVAGALAGVLLLWGVLALVNWARRAKPLALILGGAALLWGCAAVFALAMPGSVAVPASDGERFRELIVPEYQRLFAGFSAMTDDAHAFIIFDDSRIRSSQALCLCGKLQAPPAPDAADPKHLWHIGDYWALADADPEGLADFVWPARAVSRFAPAERHFWQERWEKRGNFYEIKTIASSPRFGYCWVDPQTNYAIACFR